jgi:hypothetical protein
MAGNSTNGKPRHRRTLAVALFDLCIFRAHREGWTISKSMIAKPSVKGRTLAEADFAKLTIIIHPKVIGQADPPLERSFLHELIHVGLNLSEPWADGKKDGYVYWIEAHLWRYMTAECKAKLTAMIEEGVIVP